MNCVLTEIMFVGRRDFAYLAICDKIDLTFRMRFRTATNGLGTVIIVRRALRDKIVRNSP